MDENDIADLWTDNGTTALSIVVMKNSVYTSQARAPFRPTWVAGSLSMTQLTFIPGHLWQETWRQYEHMQKLLR